MDNSFEFSDFSFLETLDGRVFVNLYISTERPEMVGPFESLEEAQDFMDEYY
jgi:hypothetical protein